MLVTKLLMPCLTPATRLRRNPIGSSMIRSIASRALASAVSNRSRILRMVSITPATASTAISISAPTGLRRKLIVDSTSFWAATYFLATESMMSFCLSSTDFSSSANCPWMPVATSRATCLVGGTHLGDSRVQLLLAVGDDRDDVVQALFHDVGDLVDHPFHGRHVDRRPLSKIFSFESPPVNRSTAQPPAK